MLLSFTLKNWMSFRQKTTLSMIATRERQHSERVAKLKKFQTKVLPVAAIYGGNASGKTNLFMALNFARAFIVEGVDPNEYISVEPYRLDSTSTKESSSFEFELLIQDVIFEYSFSVKRNIVVTEKLAVVNSNRKKIIFSRRYGKINLHKSLEKNEHLNSLVDGTWDNQLFLTNAVSHKAVYKNIKELKLVFNWFRLKLVLVAPDSRFAQWEQFIDETHPLFENMNNILEHLDTGIVRLGGEYLPFDSLPIPEQVKSKIKKDLKEEGMSVRLIINDERFVVAMSNKGVVAKKLITYHKKQDSKETPFELHYESHGSQRIIDLLPAFLDLSSKQQSSADEIKVYLIDEIDRCLHSLVTRALLETYLNNCSTETRTQLLFTTHDSSLMVQELFRRDEIWLTERNVSGESSLFSLGEFKDVRYDKDIRKSYLQGRYGGIPEIQPAEIAYDFMVENIDSQI